MNASANSNSAQIVGELDHEQLQQKYRAERDKRLRPDGDTQYVKPTGQFAYMTEDPHTEIVERDPLHDEVTVALIGGGFSGLCAGAQLKKAGVDDVRIIDGAGDVGGVWYWNRYPGAMCDTAAMVYLPLLEETGHMPTQKYTMGYEIREHAQRIAKHFQLYDNALFSTEITHLEWDADSSRWVIQTNRGDEFRAQFVAMGTGPIHEPKLPGIPGIETFQGHSFHTSRWDYDYTGGDPTGAPMDRLAGKRVGIIGTGATAVQCIPPLARDADELFVFQRTPSSIDIRNNHPIDPDEFAELKPGWQDEWLTNFATLQTGGFTDVDLVKDGWTDIAKRIRDRIIAEMSNVEMSDADSPSGPEMIMRAYELSDDEKMNEIRARVDAVVEDASTAEALKPWYRQLCKRPCFHDEYLNAFNEPGVTLVDTDGQGVEKIDETGVWVDGTHYELDCLVYASGFEVHLEHSSAYETVGANGVTLTEHWDDGMQTLHGIHTHGFPNMFIIGLSQAANLISNITHNLNESGKTIASVVAHALETGSASVDVTDQAEQDWIGQFAMDGFGFLGNADCTPGYYNNEGKPMDRRARLNGAGYPGGPVAYFEYIEKWRRSGEFQGLEFAAAKSE